MAVAWTRHRFSGGVLALDAANTVVHRGDPEKSFDRFDDIAEVARFAAAASQFRAVELGSRVLAVDDDASTAPHVLALRETADALFRATATMGAVEITLLPDFLRACAACLDGQCGATVMQGKPFGDASAPIRFEAALAVSALSLLSGDTAGRVKICRNCDWLFLDRSRNSSRMWCDMTVCGNRQKAKRHYRRSKMAREEVSHV